MNVAGMHITELYTDCIVGEIDDPDRARVGLYVPKTSNRKYHRIDIGQSTPEQMIIEAVQWIIKESDDLRYLVACFCGPFLSLDNTSAKDSKDYRNSGDYGRLGLLRRYDKHWSGLPIYQLLKDHLNQLEPRPIVRIYTDVDAGAYGEFWKRSTLTNASYYNKRANLVFLSLGRSINGGVAVKGSIFRGRHHPLMGSLRPARFFAYTKSGGVLRDEYRGCCPLHQDCLEGLIGIDALEERTGMQFSDIPNSDPVWKYVAYYAAELCISITSSWSPSRIILSGRLIKEQTDPGFSDRLLRQIRGYFYSHVNPNGDDVFSPDYAAIRRRDSFLSLPQRVVKKDGEERSGLPCIHGALRLAAKLSYEYSRHASK
jgi:predicted NBD/HSP70 family sugar kinase